MRMQFIGHATALIELDGVRLLTDPVLRGRLAHLRRHARLPAEAHRPRVDAVLISHLHHDHLDFPSLERLGQDVRLLVPRGAGPLLARRGYRHVEELGVGEAASVGDTRVVATPANHRGFRPPFGPRAECLGFLVEGSQRVYFAGDTDLFAAMRDLRPVDLALLPVWGWGPTLGPGHLDPARAVEALARIRPRLGVPIHWGTLYPFGLGRWSHTFLTRPPREFAALAARRTPEIAVRIVEPGHALELAPAAAPA